MAVVYSTGTYIGLSVGISIPVSEGTSISWQLPDGVGTNGVFAEGPQSPYIFSYLFYARMRGRILPHFDISLPHFDIGVPHFARIFP